MPATPINTGSFPKLLWPGLNKIFGITYKDKPLFYTRLFNERKSTKHFEEDLGIVPMGLAEIKTEGQGIRYDSMSQGFPTRYVHTTYGLGFIITQEEIEDNLYLNKGEIRTRGLARGLRLTKEYSGHNIFNRAFNSSYTFGDGKSLIATDHPTFGASTTISNQISTPMDFSEAALEELVIQISKAVDDRGNIISLMPKKLLVPTELMFEVTRLLKNPDRPGTADRDINALYKDGYFQDVIVSPYLDDPDAYFIITDNLIGLSFFNRRGDAFTNDNDFDTDNAKFKVTSRFVFGCTDTPRAVFGSPGA